MKEFELTMSRLNKCGIRPSTQRVAIMHFLLTHRTHPTVEDVYQGVVPRIPTLSRTTVYNTLRMFSEHHAAQMLTIDDHRICYDGDTHPHVHFFCRECGRVFDFMDKRAPKINKPTDMDGNLVDEAQLYYKGICKDCLAKDEARNQGEQAV
jgi:Fur family peroxide stress response transcriptional regulator